MKCEVKDGKLTISDIDMYAAPRQSSTGKTLLLASVGQASQVGSQVAKVAINVTIPNPQYKAPAK